MYEIQQETTIEIIEKKSKFITRIFKIDSDDKAKNILKEISKNEKGASHNCYAYRILQNDKIIEKKSDDGEPGGTAGAPMLAVLNGENLINTFVVTTRYFGGIKLGTGGLVSAYKKGAVEILKKSGKKKYVILQKITVNFPINEVTHMEYLLKKAHLKVDSKDFGERVLYTISVPEDEIEKLPPIIKAVKGTINDNMDKNQ